MLRTDLIDLIGHFVEHDKYKKTAPKAVRATAVIVAPIESQMAPVHFHGKITLSICSVTAKHTTQCLALINIELWKFRFWLAEGRRVAHTLYR